ncbi:hypothetical protein GM921_00020 [Pedobacter sp. LMG 31464]|uniref:VOC domain-containing protein n=1 Tax=Pedobacter planticolens TaxID=2679964 RepID=A0A923DWB5_9SPHI|nr:VOC family protein [Pedobacter planticolens]MBB2143855.1 hypothetical protein [Pedobacter planticolens]
MKLALVYTCLKVNDICSATQFLRDILGFEEDKFNLDVFDGGLVFTNGEHHKIVLVECAEEVQNPTILLLTNDCIRDYHSLLDKGIRFTKTPDYTDNGLIAEFLDPFGNCYCLLEERNYKLN